MLKKTIKYVDYDGNPREESFYFNLTKVECAEMEVSAKGGIVKLIDRIIAEKDEKRIVELFKDFILRSYGEKSDDGKHFVKTPELTMAFSQTEAYVELFMELASNAEAAQAFVTAVLPQNM